MIVIDTLIDRADLKAQFDSLKQGDVIRYKANWNDDLVYHSQIEVNRFGEKFVCGVHNYPNPGGMRFYNRLPDFRDLTFFEKIQCNTPK